MAPPPVLHPGGALRPAFLDGALPPDDGRPRARLQRLGPPPIRKRRAVPALPPVLRDQVAALSELDRSRGHGAPDVCGAAPDRGEAAGERLRAALPRGRLVSRGGRASG